MCESGTIIRFDSMKHVAVQKISVISYYVNPPPKRLSYNRIHGLITPGS